jgi:hypothetical protein
MSNRTFQLLKFAAKPIAQAAAPSPSTEHTASDDVEAVIARIALTLRRGMDLRGLLFWEKFIADCLRSRDGFRG